MLKGIAVSDGIGIGKAYILMDEKLDINDEKITDISCEIDRFLLAVEECKKQINELYIRTIDAFGEEKAKIFKAHSMIASDEALLAEVKNKIKNDKCNAVFALNQVSNQFVDMFAKMDNEYMKERAADIKDVSSRLLRILLGVKSQDLSILPPNTVIVADDLTPSDTAQLNKENVVGIVTRLGGRTSHTAIMSRTMEIPAVVGANEIFVYVSDDDNIIIDGFTGKIIVNPDEVIIKEYEDGKIKQAHEKEELKKLVGLSSITKDGYHVVLASNIGNIQDAKASLKHDTEAVGLLRSEFLYMDRTRLPSEDEQFKAYKDVLQAMGDKPVIIRTLDIGGDKELPYLDMPKEMNPFLGYRAIRICLDRTDIFKTQLRALIRASAFGKLQIMFPMISSIEELREAKKLYLECKQEIVDQQIVISDYIQIGMMVEIPSVAIMADVFAKEVDFFSIGTNDLIQYTTAVDRMNAKITHLYNHFHPAILRLVNMVIKAGHENGIWIGMCGEAAGEPLLIPLLMGMGLDEFSMSATSTLKARKIIRSLSKEELEESVEKVLQMATAKEVEAYLEGIAKNLQATGL